MPDGRVLPFCTFNVFPEIYRDKLQRQYAIPSKQWQEMHHDWTYASDKYKRDVKALESSDVYKKAYENMGDYFTFPVNREQALINKSAKSQRAVAAQPMQMAAMSAAAGHSHSEDAKEEHGHAHEAEAEGDSCACGGKCGCGGSC
jgi:hypothetical protein